MTIQLRSLSHRRRHVKPDFEIVTKHGGRCDWSPDGNLIAFDRLVADTYQIVTIRPNGQLEVDLTTGKGGAPASHKGNPAWHPSGAWIAFQAVDPEYAGADDESWPGRGHGNSLWITNADGDAYHHVYDRSGAGWLLHPVFSPDGNWLAWSESNTASQLTDWQICVAAFTAAPNPAIGVPTTYQPVGAVWYEVHSYHPAGTTLLYTAHVVPLGDAWFDIYAYTFAGASNLRLTFTDTVWDEHAHYRLGDPTTLSCSSSEGQDVATKLEIWTMDNTGANRQQRTHVNDINHRHYAGPAIASAGDNAWSPNGRDLAIRVRRGNNGIDDWLCILHL